MIDTVVLLLSAADCRIDDLSLLTTPIRRTKLLKKNIYRPRVTYYEGLRGRGATVRVECSLPKLLLGNNFHELENADFDRVTEVLKTSLDQLGVGVERNAIQCAHVSAIHYSKNIILSDGMTPYSLINVIGQAHAPLRLDVNKTDFRNDGHSYKWHTNSYEIIFYDKIRDLEVAQKSLKRAVEKDAMTGVDVAKKLRNSNGKCEVLRMEVRLNKRAKINQLLSCLGVTADLTLHDLFDAFISQKVLLHYLDEIEKTRHPLMDATRHNDREFFSQLVVSNPKQSPQQLLATFGLKKLLESTTTRHISEMLGRARHRSLQRLLNATRTVTVPTIQQSLHVIRTQIKEGTRLRALI